MRLAAKSAWFETDDGLYQRSVGSDGGPNGIGEIIIVS